MKITTAMVADGAHVHAGKVYVLGGAFDTIYAQSLPTKHAIWTLVLVAQVEQGERQRDLTLQITLADEDNNPALFEAEAVMRVGAPPMLQPGQASVVPMAIPLPEVTFPEAKGYSFRVEFGGHELARIPFRVAPKS